MKKIINPTNDKIEVQIFGVVYTVEPKSSVSIPSSAAEYWKDSLHGFLELEDTEVQNSTKQEISPVKVLEVSDEESEDEPEEEEVKVVAKVSKKK